MVILDNILVKTLHFFPLLYHSATNKNLLPTYNINNNTSTTKDLLDIATAYGIENVINFEKR